MRSGKSSQTANSASDIDGWHEPIHESAWRPALWFGSPTWVTYLVHPTCWALSMFIKQMWPGYIAIGIHVLTGALVHFEP